MIKYLTKEAYDALNLQEKIEYTKARMKDTERFRNQRKADENATEGEDLIFPSKHLFVCGIEEGEEVIVDDMLWHVGIKLRLLEWKYNGLFLASCKQIAMLDESTGKFVFALETQPENLLYPSDFDTSAIPKNYKMELLEVDQIPTEFEKLSFCQNDKIFIDIIECEYNKKFLGIFSPKGFSPSEKFKQGELIALHKNGKKLYNTKVRGTFVEVDPFTFFL